MSITIENHKLPDSIKSSPLLGDGATVNYCFAISHAERKIRNDMFVKADYVP